MRSEKVDNVRRFLGSQSTTTFPAEVVLAALDRFPLAHPRAVAEWLTEQYRSRPDPA